MSNDTAPDMTSTPAANDGADPKPPDGAPLAAPEKTKRTRTVVLPPFRLLRKVTVPGENGAVRELLEVQPEPSFAERDDMDKWLDDHGIPGAAYGITRLGPLIFIEEREEKVVRRTRKEIPA